MLTLEDIKNVSVEDEIKTLDGNTFERWQIVTIKTMIREMKTLLRENEDLQGNDLGVETFAMIKQVEEKVRLFYENPENFRQATDVFSDDLANLDSCLETLRKLSKNDERCQITINMVINFNTTYL